LIFLSYYSAFSTDPHFFPQSMDRVPSPVGRWSEPTGVHPLAFGRVPPIAYILIRSLGCTPYPRPFATAHRLRRELHARVQQFPARQGQDHDKACQGIPCGDGQGAVFFGELGAPDIVERDGDSRDEYPGYAGRRRSSQVVW
jgi:hypothetical protein